MKTLKLLLTAIIVVNATQISAKVFRVNNNTTIDAPYNNFTTALIAADPHDTIYLEGSNSGYGNLVISKPLVVIGTGYFIIENPQTHADLLTSSVGSVTFEDGSSGSTIQGLSITADIYIKVGHLIIKKNHCGEIWFDSSNSYGNIIIAQNFILQNNASNVKELIANQTGNSTIYNVLFCNNIIKTSRSQYIGHLYLGSNYSGILSNNILETNVNLNNFNIINNIHRYGSMVHNNNSFFNNIGSTTQFPTENDNLQNINMGDIFLGSGSTDGWYQLKETSPAVGYGNDGMDCGAFGGLIPYILSGMPDIPSIYEINIPAMGTSTEGINVTVKAKVHK
jgi:hypothetical protein